MKLTNRMSPTNLQAVESRRQYFAAPLVNSREMFATNEQIMERSPDI
jgi:hypothetical protein